MAIKLAKQKTLTSLQNEMVEPFTFQRFPVGVPTAPENGEVSPWLKMQIEAGLMAEGEADLPTAEVVEA